MISFLFSCINFFFKVNFNEANLFELHQQLKAEKSDGQSVREAVERLQRDLQQAENRCSDLEQIVQNVYRRRQLESSITLYKKKRAFAVNFRQE